MNYGKKKFKLLNCVQTAYDKLCIRLTTISIYVYFVSITSTPDDIRHALFI